MVTVSDDKKVLDELYGSFDKLIFTKEQDLIQENANVDGLSPMGKISIFASESSKRYTMEKLLLPEVAEAMKNNFIHIHDLDYYATGSTTCTQIPLNKLLANGFDTGHGTMREPQSISSALALAAIIFQANQNQQHGGQSFPKFDFDLAPYVRKSHKKHIKALSNLPLQDGVDLDKLAWEMTEKETYQACEAFVHNLNSMHSRGGGQVAFTSINYGTDTSREGRLLIKSVLRATMSGLGNNETPIFPIHCFKVKEGVNFNEGDPNYDLFKIAIETTSKRLFPNFVFLDAPFNAQYYDGTPESEVAMMGCRTRTMGNVNGPENSMARGNLSFTSINLVKIAIESHGNIDFFFEELDKYSDLVIKQLLERFEFQANRKANEFKFLYSEGVWNGAEKLAATDNVREILKQGTLAIGFVGLAESLKALIGLHHGESDTACNLGYKIVKFLREKADKACDEYSLNFSLIATPAESLAGKLARRDQAHYGKIAEITDRQYYTNSYHVPVYHNVKAIDKIKIEAPFHALCNGGHITYIELDGNASKNLEALEMIIRTMGHYNIGYGSINHPVDRCDDCGHQGIIYNECPKCGNDDQEKIDRIRRITGYLTGSLNRWNSGKKAEELDRVKHC
ncbi:MAG: nrdD [Bacillales bacterium]|nr:nrdD [Bacillales bacterium]